MLQFKHIFYIYITHTPPLKNDASRRLPAKLAAAPQNEAPTHCSFAVCQAKVLIPTAKGLSTYTAITTTIITSCPSCCVGPNSLTMPELGEWTFTTLQDAGVVLPPAAPLHLLPLMRPAKQAKAPLERLPGGAPAPDRLAFETESETSGKTAWLSSVHLFPAAFPRSHFTSTCRPGPAQPEPNAELLTADRARERELRNTDMQTADEQLTMSPIESFFPPLDEAEAYRTAKTLVDSEQPQLWSCIQRIVPSRQKNDGQRGKGVTLFLAHANGFHKEVSKSRGTKRRCVKGGMLNFHLSITDLGADAAFSSSSV